MVIGAVISWAIFLAAAAVVGWALWKKARDKRQ